MKYVTLTKLRSLNSVVSKNPLRTESIVGVELTPPKVGSGYRVLNDEPLDDDEADARMVVTSPIKVLLQGSTRTLFQTENSEYEVRYTEEL